MAILRIKSPYLCLFYALPLLAVLAHDLYMWQITGGDFHFSETGYLLQHYWNFGYEKIINVWNNDTFLDFLDWVLNLKAALATGVPALLIDLWLNRHQHGTSRPSVPRFRR